MLLNELILLNGKNDVLSIENLPKALATELYYLLLPYKKMVFSITSDNGSEFYEPKRIAQLLNTKFYFAHPYSSVAFDT